MKLEGTLLVTGGTGYIGSHTVLELMRKTAVEVVSIDNYYNSTDAPIRRIHDITGRTYVNHNADLCDFNALRNVFAKYTNIIGIIHFGALKSVPESTLDPARYYNNNINGLVNVLRCCEEFGVSNFIFSSSATVYGTLKELPVNEQSASGEALSPYGLTKILGERILEDYCTYKNLQVISLRYFNPAGADATGLLGEDPINKFGNLTPIIVAAAAGEFDNLTVYGTDYDTRDGSCIRDYIHITDIVDAHILAMEYLLKKENKKRYEMYNLGSGKGISVLEMIDAFERVSGVKVPYKIGPRRPGDVPAVYSDSTLAEKVLGWKPKYDVDDIMRTAWKWKQHLVAEKTKL